MIEGAEERPPRFPRIWPSLAAMGIAPVAAFLVSAFALVMPYVLAGTPEYEEWLVGFATSFRGILTLVLPGQVIFLGIAIGGALLSPEPLRRRLGLVAPRVPLLLLLPIIAATFAVNALGQLLASLAFPEPTEHVRWLENLFGDVHGPLAIWLLFFFSVPPGFCEELLFRGYVLGRLLTRWPAVPAIALTSFVFALMHFDPMHALGVLPLSIWLGVVLWGTHSVWPCIACHVFNNAVAVSLSRVDVESDVAAGAIHAGMILCFLSLLAALPILWRGARSAAPD
ncbi:MAG: CPBP family intramembrane metalloprotease [Planctomycetota bacterium]|nr:CPBP family intramembrane metalloprotease [Planctomycetota bacterium]